MIDEHAVFAIAAGKEAEFEAAYAVARPLLLAAGATRADLSRCIEEPSRYLLLATWPTVEAHTEGFRGSEAFVQWRALIGPFFAHTPEVTHYASVALP